jgi:myo-inositol-1(or 4)-monophosphatase
MEKVLIESTMRVRARVEEIARSGKREDSVGVGASGDKTILADKVAENEILDAIRSEGKISVLSEEAGWVGDPGSNVLAIVDPLDGSSNFEKGIPFYCTSVAVSEGKTLDGIFLAVVRDLVSGAVYVARKGKGASKDGKKVVTGDVTKVGDAVIGIDMSRADKEIAASLAPLVTAARRQVHFGANALEMCYLAEGKIDAFVDLRGRIRISDFAAAHLIAKEAGATITDPSGGQLNPEFEVGKGFSFVASANARLHKEILELCRPHGGR